MELFEEAVKRQVVFVPGEPFYTTGVKTSAFRLNFSCVDEELAREGIRRLSEAIETIINKQDSSFAEKTQCVS